MLEWNVFVENFNKKEIEIYNVFSHYRLEEFLKKAKKDCTDNQQFAELLEREVRYLFWSKCEWEIILSDWPPSDKFNDKKVDVYQQLKLNWDRFVDYVWENI